MDKTHTPDGRLVLTHHDRAVLACLRHGPATVQGMKEVLSLSESSIRIALDRLLSDKRITKRKGRRNIYSIKEDE